MTQIGIPPRGTDDRDLPRSGLRDQRAIVITLLAMYATHSPSDRIAYALDLRLIAHPEHLTSQSGDPEWDRWLATRIAECAATRRTT